MLCVDLMTQVQGQQQQQAAQAKLMTAVLGLVRRTPSSIFGANHALHQWKSSLVMLCSHTSAMRVVQTEEVRELRAANARLLEELDEQKLINRALMEK
jgi:hypothetical protein